MGQGDFPRRDAIDDPPVGPLLPTLESVRTERNHQAVFGHVKIIHVFEGVA
ncbi:hypothetical protein GCM10009746_29540 [Microbacterium paludicola]